MNKYDELDDFEEFEYIENLISDLNNKEKKSEPEEKIAVAIRFDPEKDTAPRIVAAGKGKTAEEIIDIAREEEVPIYQDELLAGGLSHIEVGAVIPNALYEIIAEVLIFLYQINEEWLISKIGEDNFDEIQ